MWCLIEVESSQSSRELNLGGMMTSKSFRSERWPCPFHYSFMLFARETTGQSYVAVTIPKARVNVPAQVHATYS